MLLVIKAGTFSLFDKATDPMTNLSPPIAKSKIPIGKSKYWVNISLFNNQKNNSLLIKSDSFRHTASDKHKNIGEIKHEKRIVLKKKRRPRTKMKKINF